jgi:hypothetical protein
MEGHERLALWTFQRHANARSFYEAHGFRCVRFTAGRDNEEHEPDALYEWTRYSSRSSSRRISLVPSKPRRS